MRSGQRQRDGERKAAQQQRRKRAAQQPHVPRRGDDVDAVNPKLQLLQTGDQPAARKLLGLLVAVEALLLQDELGHAVPEESNAAIVGLGYDSENAQGSNT